MVNAEEFEAAVAALLAGEAIGMPTDTVYGVGSLPEHQQRVFEVKRRPEEVRMPVLVADVEQALTVGEHHEFMDRYWPGALTIVTRKVRADGDAGPKTVGLRCPDFELVRELCRRVGPLSVSSANIHGEPPLTTAEQVRAQFPGVVVLDGGTCDGLPSTVVDVTEDPVKVLRQGALVVE